MPVIELMKNWLEIALDGEVESQNLQQLYYS